MKTENKRQDRSQRSHLESLEPRLLLSTTLLTEGFEGIFPVSWSVGDANAAGTPAYWNDVNAAFGGEGTHSGSWKGYCAGSGYAGTTTAPTYQNYMSAYMSRSINLTGYVTASLSFWYKIPSIESGFDYARVYIDSTKVWERDTSQTNWTNETISLNTYAGGSHTLKFQFDSDGSVTYEGWYLDDITVVAVDGDTNDQISEATVVGIGGSRTGTISPGIDVDMYRVDVSAGQRLGFDIDRGSGGLDSHLRLFNSSGTQLASNDNGTGPGTEPSGLDPYIEYVFPSTGSYYIGVSSAGNTGYNPVTGDDDSFGSTTGNWTLHVQQADSPWHMGGSGDFNNDGDVDILWHNKQTGIVGAWLLTDGAYSSWVKMGVVPYANWEIGGVGDFDGNSHVDVLWHNKQTGVFGAWLLTSGAVTGWMNIGVVSYTTWEIGGVRDMDGNGHVDILWRNKQTGTLGAWLLINGVYNSWMGMPAVPYADWEIAGVGDFDGIGHTDILWRNKHTGAFGAWLMVNGVFSSWAPIGLVPYAGGWEIGGVGDINGDGTSDILWHHRTLGTVGAWLLVNAAYSSYIPIGVAV